MTINPILNREVITLFRRPRTYFWISVYLAILIFATLSSWPDYAIRSGVIDMIRASRHAAVGILCIMTALILVLLPSYMATTFTREKEENTLSSLTVTQLSVFDIISGKLQVGVFYTLYLIIISLPLLGALYKLGGFAISEIIQGYIIIFFISIAICLWSMFFSVISSTSYKAVSRSYFFFFLLLFCLGIVSTMLHGIGLGFIFNSSYVNPFLSIQSIFFGSYIGHLRGFNFNLSKYTSTNLIFGFFYEETIKIIAFYTLVSLIFILMIMAAYRRLQYKW